MSINHPMYHHITVTLHAQRLPVNHVVYSTTRIRATNDKHLMYPPHQRISC